MNKEEREAIEYYQDKEISFGVNFDTEKLLRSLGITEEDSFENHQIRFKTLLNLIEKLQKENEKLKRENKNIKEANYYWSSRYCNICNNSIPKQKIKEKIEKYKNMCISNVEGYENYFKDNYDELVFRRMEQLEKELLGDK